MQGRTPEIQVFRKACEGTQGAIPCFTTFQKWKIGQGFGTICSSGLNRKPTKVGARSRTGCQTHHELTMEPVLLKRRKEKEKNTKYMYIQLIYRYVQQSSNMIVLQIRRIVSPSPSLSDCLCRRTFPFLSLRPPSLPLRVCTFPWTLGLLCMDMDCFFK